MSKKPSKKLELHIKAGPNGTALLSEVLHDDKLVWELKYDPVDNILRDDMTNLSIGSGGEVAWTWTQMVKNCLSDDFIDYGCYHPHWTIESIEFVGEEIHWVEVKTSE